jgi:hypothetical protein
MSSSFGGEFLAALAKALRDAKLEAIVVENTASILNGAPVITEDVDLLVRDTPPIDGSCNGSRPSWAAVPPHRCPS